MVLSCLSVKHPSDLPPGGALYPSKLKFSVSACLSLLGDSILLCGLSSLLREEGLLPFMCSALHKYLQVCMGGQGAHS